MASPHLSQPAAAIGDDAALQQLRLAALALADGTDLSRCDDHQVVEHIEVAVAQKRLAAVAAAPPVLRRLAPAPAPPPAAAAPAPASAPRSAPAAVEAPPETTFSLDLDVAAMVAVLQQAAQDGTPFCEECARAAAAQAAGAGA